MPTHTGKKTRRLCSHSPYITHIQQSNPTPPTPPPISSVPRDFRSRSRPGDSTSHNYPDGQEALILNQTGDIYYAATKPSMADSPNSKYPCFPLPRISLSSPLHNQSM
ncbi:hypothetical protein FALCPG4_010551 [Fusarium falciforme]